MALSHASVTGTLHACKPLFVDDWDAVLVASGSLIQSVSSKTGELMGSFAGHAAMVTCVCGIDLPAASSSSSSSSGVIEDVQLIGAKQSPHVISASADGVLIVWNKKTFVEVSRVALPQAAIFDILIPETSLMCSFLTGHHGSSSSSSNRSSSSGGGAGSSSSGSGGAGEGHVLYLVALSDRKEKEGRQEKGKDQDQSNGGSEQPEAQQGSGPSSSSGKKGAAGRGSDALQSGGDGSSVEPSYKLVCFDPVAAKVRLIYYMGGRWTGGSLAHTQASPLFPSFRCGTRWARCGTGGSA